MATTPAQVEINEYNDAGGDETNNISNCNYGSADDPNLTISSSTIGSGNNSYEKYWKVDYVEDFDSSQIEDAKIWRLGDLGGSTTHKIGHTTSFTQPVTTGSSVATATFPETENSNGTNGVPLGGNIERSGVAGASFTVDGHQSDYIVSQIQTDSGDSGATTFTIMFSWFETQA